MTTKADFTEDEWTRIKRAPFLAGMTISLADPGGPIEAVRESSATLRTVLRGAEDGEHGELVRAVARDVAEGAQQHKSPVAGYRPQGGGANVGIELLGELRETSRVIAEKAAPDEAAGFGAWLVSVAQEAANAAKEGGFMGFHAQRVSEGEQRMLESVREAVGATT